MSWLFGKKREKEVEELPELPELPILPELPEFREQKIKEEFSPPLLFQGIEKPKLTFQTGMLTKEIGDEKIEPFKAPELETGKKTARNIKEEPIFIRIDKYQESLSNFQEIKQKLLEIESLLKDVKEIKTREESQLQEWEQEIQEAKSNLDKIDKTIFRKIE